MGEIAKWGPKSFVISPQKIVPFIGLSTSVALKTDSENDTSGTAPTNTKGLELQQISFSTTYFRGVGVDPRAQWEEWKTLVGSSNPLYIGGELFGPAKLLLKQVTLSDVETDHNGKFTSAVVELSFEEYPNGTTSKSTTSTKTTSTAKKNSTSSSTTNTSSSQKAAAAYAATVEKKKAMNTGASASDKAAKK